MSRLFKLLLLSISTAILVFSATSCNNDNEEPMPETNNIADIVAGNANFSILLAALQEADLVTTFQGNGPFTVFAPTDAAFEAFLQANNLTSAELLASPQLEAILQYHVVSGSSVVSSQLTNGAVGTLNGDVYVNVDNGVVINGYSTVSQADIAADNGTIHAVDAVLVPPTGTVVDIASGNDDFSTLVSLLTELDLAGTLGGDGPFTVFAPTNAAFAAIEAELGTLTDEEKTNILLYHVVAGRVFSNDLETGSVPTLNTRKNLPVDVSNGVQVGGVDVVAANLLGTNGVVHVVNEVLIPEDNIVDVVLENDNFSILRAALQEADLVSTFDGEGPFTVFAPTDAAFEAYLAETGMSAAELLASDQLTAILQYHVVGSAVTSSELTDGPVTTLNGDIYVNTSDGVVINGEIEVVDADIEVSNGVIHAIGSVLVPPSGTIVDIAAGNDDFSTLVDLLTQYDLAGTLGGDGPFTVFARTNAAFEAITATLGTLSDAEIIDILLYHVVSGRAFSNDLMTGELATLNTRKDLPVDLSMGVQVGNGSVTDPNILGTNGVIHVVDEVLLPERTVVDVALYNDNFSSLAAAIEKAGLVETLDDAEDITVFAPTNAAFETLLTNLGVTLDDLTADDLTPILTYHVLGIRALSTDLVDGTFYETLNGAAFQFDAGNLAFNDAQGNSVGLEATLLDIEEPNGVVHVVNDVLLPPSENIVEIAAADATFSTLVTLLQRVGLDETLADDGPFTVFAPTDQAFTDLGIDPATLTDEQVTDILSYHVIGDRVFSSELSDGATVGVLLEGADITINIGGTVTITDDSDTTPDDATVTATDIQGTNGVIHVIDKVLLPITVE